MCREMQKGFAAFEITARGIERLGTPTEAAPRVLRPAKAFPARATASTVFRPIVQKQKMLRFLHGMADTILCWTVG